MGPSLRDGVPNSGRRPRDQRESYSAATHPSFTSLPPTAAPIGHRPDVLPLDGGTLTP